MLRLHGFGRVTSHLSPTGLSMGSRQIHYAWVIVALASGMGLNAVVAFQVAGQTGATRQASAGAMAPSPLLSPCSGLSQDW